MRTGAWPGAKQRPGPNTAAEQHSPAGHLAASGSMTSIRARDGHGQAGLIIDATSASREDPPSGGANAGCNDNCSSSRRST